jgi:hypothetical protein
MFPLHQPGKKSRNTASPLLLFCFFLFISECGTLAAEWPSARLLRVSLISGDVTYQRPDLDKWIELSLNTPLAEGDKVWVGRDARVEIEFDDGSTLRLAENTVLEFARLGYFGELRDADLFLNRGLATFSVAEGEGSYVVDAPLYSVKLQKQAILRAEVESDDSGRVAVLEGKAELRSQAASLFLAKGEVVSFRSDNPDRYYLSSYSLRDDWDRWNEQRDEYVRKLKLGRPAELDYGWSLWDLDQYGSWEYISGYGRVWRPHAGPEWVPFRDGRWVWYNDYGWTWISFEPWGWYPYHYGRWEFVLNRGWYWVPGPGIEPWCPGAVAWIEWTGWIGWVPLAPAEPWYPSCCVPPNIFIPRHWRHDDGFTCIPRDRFATGRVERGAPRPNDFRKLARVMPGPPSVTPAVQGRMPVVGSAGKSRTFTNDDLEGRRAFRDSMIQSTVPANALNPAGANNVTRQTQGRQVIRIPDERSNVRTVSGGDSSIHLVEGQRSAEPPSPESSSQVIRVRDEEPIGRENPRSDFPRFPPAQSGDELANRKPSQPSTPSTPQDTSGRNAYRPPSASAEPPRTRWADERSAAPVAPSAPPPTQERREVRTQPSAPTAPAPPPAAKETPALSPVGGRGVTTPENSKPSSSAEQSGRGAPRNR